MTKARTLANFISDGSPLADGTISVSEVSGAAPLASPSFTGTVTTDAVTMNGYLTVNGGGVDVNTVIYPNGIAMEDSRAISFGTGADFELSSGGTFLDHNLKDNARHLRIVNGLTEHHRFSGDGNVIFNNSGADADFRVESDTNTHMLFVDASTNRIGINDSSPSYTVDVLQSTNSAGDGVNLQPANATQNMTYSFLGTTSTYFTEFLVDSNDSGTGGYRYFKFYEGTRDNNGELLYLGYNGTVFNDVGADRDFRVESDSNTHMLFVDAGNNRIGINESSPDAFLDISGNGATTSKMFEISTVGIGGGPTSTFYGGYVQVQANNNATDNFGWYVTANHSGIDSDTTGIYGLATMNSSSNRSIGAYGSSSVNSGAVHNAPSTASSKVAAGVYADATTTGTSSNSTNAALVAYNKTTYGNTAYGAYIRADNGPTNVKPLVVDYAGNNIFEVDAADGITVNESSRDYTDFRVESDLDSHMLFVDASTNRVGINRSNPDAPLHLQAGSSGGSLADAFQISDNTYVNIAMYSGGADGEIRIGAAGVLRGSYKAQYAGTRSSNDFHVGVQDTTGMFTIDGAGSALIINERSAGTDFRVESNDQTHMFFVDAGENAVMMGLATPASGGFNSATRFVMNASGNYVLGLRTTNSSGTNNEMIDFRDGDDQRMGLITGNSSANTVTYGTSSDRSLKENDRPIPNPVDRVKSLNPVLFDWISDGTSSEGFIAQELEQDTQLGIDTVAGEDGEKNVDYGRLTPLLTAALKEAITKIEELEARITALENA